MASATAIIAKCTCSAQPPAGKKKKSGNQKQSSSKEDPKGKDLRKLYSNLQKEHERVGMAFQNLQDQNEQLVQDLAERDADLEELTNLVSSERLGNSRRSAASTLIVCLVSTVGTRGCFRCFRITAAAWPMRFVSLDVRGAPSGTSWRLPS